MGFTKRMLEEAEDRMFWPSGAGVCPAHVSDAYLITVVATVDEPGRCAVCGLTRAPLVDYDDLRDRVVVVVREYRRRAIDELFHDAETETGYALPDGWMEDTTDVVDDLFADAFDDDLREAVARSLEPDYWFRPGRLWLEGAELYLESWTDFRRLLRSRPASLNELLRGALDDDGWMHEAADGLQPSQLLGGLLDLVHEVGVVKTIAPSARWFRAVHIPAGDTLTASRLGTAPPAYSTENRMNRAGEPMFYGALDARTAVTEIGSPPAGAATVIGVWRATRPLYVLDLADLGDPPHLYDIENAALRWRHLFLADFALDVSQPVAPHEPDEYRPTQIFTEYLRLEATHLDGILYRSSLTGGTCCAIDVDNTKCVAAEAGPAVESLELHFVLDAITTPPDASVGPTHG